MASPAPIATLRQLARQGWPLLVAALLTLLLGWSALREGTRTSHIPAPAVRAQASAPAAPPGDIPHEQAMPAGEAEPDGSRGTKPPLLRHLCGPLPDTAPAPASPQAPRPAPLPSPSYRQPPGQAPPALMA